MKIFSKNSLGIDIGTSSIKIVELSRKRGGFVLENYGEVQTASLYEKKFRTIRENTLLLSTQDIAKGIEAVLEEADIKTREVSFSIPDFSSFFTSFELPPMPSKEIPQAVRYEAHHHIPLPMSEVALDWIVIDSEEGKPKSSPLKILSMAIPNEVINQYQQIAVLSKLKLIALEGEVFALSRSAIQDKEKVIALLDIGAQSSTVSIVEKGILKTSHSFDISANELTGVIAKSLDIKIEEAEKIKKKQGLSKADEKGEKLDDILSPIIDLIIAQLIKITEQHYRTEAREVEKIVLAGGSALLAGLKGYFYDKIKKEIVIANPFKDFVYPPILESTLKVIGPAYAIAVGLAMRELL